jgi:hypothetical protein
VWWVISTNRTLRSDISPVPLVATAFILTSATFAFSALTIHHLRANAHVFSPKTYRLHLQLIVLVILQAFIFTFFLYDRKKSKISKKTMVPICIYSQLLLLMMMMMIYAGSILFYIGFMSSDMNPSLFVGQLTLLMVLFFTLGNAMLSIFALNPYRRLTLALLRGRWVSNNFQPMYFNF